MSSDFDSRFKERCPRQLSSLPRGWCPLAVLRLKAMRSLGRELSEQEEENLPGCKWAIDSQMAGYCWFVHEAACLSEEPASDVEIASRLGISVDTVKKTAQTAMAKLQASDNIKQIRETYGQDSVVSESVDPDFNTVYCE